MNELLIVGFGPGSPDYLTRSASSLLEAADLVLVESLTHPVSQWLSLTRSVREARPENVSASVLESRHASLDVVVGVSGNPTPDNPLVRALLDPMLSIGPVRPIPGLSRANIADAAIARRSSCDIFQVVSVDSRQGTPNDVDSPFRGVYRLVDPTHPVIVDLETCSADDRDVLHRVLEPYPPDHHAITTFFDERGEARVTDESVADVARGEPDQHQRLIVVDPLERLADRASFDTLRYIVARLRAPDGCPWDREQDYGSIKKHLIEETYEAVAALDDRDLGKFAEELGDVLLQVVMYSQLGREAGDFTIEDILRAVNDKLVRRHPHVFGEVEVKDSAEVLRNWEKIKKTEQTSKPSTFGGVPEAAPALMRAEAIQSRAERFGWERPTNVRDATAITANDPDRDAQLGALGNALFDLVSVARRYHLDPEEALRIATNRFRLNFEGVLSRLAQTGVVFDALPADERIRLLGAATTNPASGSEPT